MLNTLSFVFVERSTASKIGPIAATYSDRRTCPTSCPLYGNGCYAESGNAGLIHMERRKDVKRVDFDGLLDGISSIPNGDLWRHDIGGDLPGLGNDIDPDMVRALVTANAGDHKPKLARRGKKHGYTFTHKPVLDHASNRDLVAEANERGFRVNVSGDNLGHADRLADLNIAPVVTVLPREYMRRTSRQSSTNWVETISEYKERLAALPRHTPAGRRIAVCPATYMDRVNCASCGACSRLREAIIGFPAHGSRYNTVNRITTAA